MSSLLETTLLLGLLVVAVTGLQPRQKRDDEGNMLTVSTIVEPPYLVAKEGDESDKTVYEGFIADIMKSLGKELERTFEFKVVEDGKYGAEESPGKWNGMIGVVMNRDADMAAAPMTISAQRQKVVDFTDPFMTFGGTVLLLKATDDATLPEVTEISELASQDVIKYGVVRDGETENFFRVSTNPQYQKIWETMSNNPSDLVSTVEEGVQRVRDGDGKYAFIMEGVTADYWSNMLPCNLRVVGNATINPVSYGFVLRKNNPLLGEMNRGLATLKEAGVIEQHRAKWWNGHCSAAYGPSAALAPRVALVVLSMILARLALM